MRVIALSGLILAVACSNLVAVPIPDDSKSTGPTEKQLAAAREAYAKFGAKYSSWIDSRAGRPVHVFAMPLQTTDAQLVELPDLPFGFQLSLTSTRVTSAGLKDLKQLKNLAYVELSRSQVTDTGLNELKSLKNLTSLGLASTRITDSGLKKLKEVKNLAALNIGGNAITDAGLKELKELK